MVSVVTHPKKAKSLNIYSVYSSANCSTGLSKCGGQGRPSTVLVSALESGADGVAEPREPLLQRLQLGLQAVALVNLLLQSVGKGFGVLVARRVVSDAPCRWRILRALERLPPRRRRLCAAAPRCRCTALFLRSTASCLRSFSRMARSLHLSRGVPRFPATACAVQLLCHRGKLLVRVSELGFDVPELLLQRKHELLHKPDVLAQSGFVLVAWSLSGFGFCGGGNLTNTGQHVERRSQRRSHDPTGRADRCFQRRTAGDGGGALVRARRFLGLRSDGGS